jgi:hypothetical protein
LSDEENRGHKEDQRKPKKSSHDPPALRRPLIARPGLHSRYFDPISAGVQRTSG